MNSKPFTTITNSPMPGCPTMTTPLEGGGLCVELGLRSRVCLRLSTSIAASYSLRMSMRPGATPFRKEPRSTALNSKGFRLTSSMTLGSTDDVAWRDDEWICMPLPHQAFQMGVPTSSFSVRSHRHQRGESLSAWQSPAAMSAMTRSVRGSSSRSLRIKDDSESPTRSRHGTVTPRCHTLPRLSLATSWTTSNRLYSQYSRQARCLSISASSWTETEDMREEGTNKCSRATKQGFKRSEEWVRCSSESVYAYPLTHRRLMYRLLRYACAWASNVCLSTHSLSRTSRGRRRRSTLLWNWRRLSFLSSAGKGECASLSPCLLRSFIQRK